MGIEVLSFERIVGGMELLKWAVKNCAAGTGLLSEVRSAREYMDNTDNKTDNKKRQAGKDAHKNQKTNENVHSVTTCKKRQQKQQSRFLQG
jgi:hypothetical protein